MSDREDDAQTISQQVRARLALFNVSAAYKKCFCDEAGNLTKAGERVLRDLASFGGFSKSPVRVSPISRQIDPLATMVATGRAEVVRRVVDFIHIDPTTHPLMKDDHE